MQMMYVAKASPRQSVQWIPFGFGDCSTFSRTHHIEGDFSLCGSTKTPSNWLRTLWNKQEQYCWREIKMSDKHTHAHSEEMCGKVKNTRKEVFNWRSLGGGDRHLKIAEHFFFARTFFFLSSLVCALACVGLAHSRFINLVPVLFFRVLTYTLRCTLMSGKSIDFHSFGT